MQKIKNFFSEFWPVFVLGFFSTLLFFLNYKPGTWLLGWDNLVPEFNFGLNIKRAVFSSWQEYQGLGLAGGMAHGASLSRELILWPLSFIIPADFIRYFWTLLMLILGPISVWFLTNFLLEQKEKQNSFKVASLIAGCFYLFNLATLQYFYIPFETFSSFYGFLPLLILFSLKFLTLENKKSAFYLLLVSFFSTSAFQVQTLFVVYLLVMFAFLFNFILKFNLKNIKKAISWGSITLIANLFWIIPVAYFTFFHSAVNLEAQQNQLTTPEVILMNQNYGDGQDILSLQGYWFDFLDRDENLKITYLLEPWREYLEDKSLLLIVRVMVGAGLLGCFLFAVSYRKQRFNFVVFILPIFIFFLLTAGKLPFGILYRFFDENIPLFSQIFRTTFTKWSVAFVLFIAIGSSFLFNSIYQLTNKWLKIILLVFVFSLIVIPVIPFFQGKLIYQRMRVELPIEYLELFDFFNQQPKQARIALLPAESIYGWDTYSWGYRGSGFLWYGIEQPILSRAFDVFSKADENFYHQFSNSLRSGKVAEIEAVLFNYDIDFLLLDKSINFNNNFNYEQLISLVDFEKKFEKNNLIVWQKKSINNSFINKVENADFVNFGEDFQARKIPSVYAKSISRIVNNNYLEFPFLFLTKPGINSISGSENYVSFNSKLAAGKYSLNIPAINNDAKVIIFAKLNLNDGVVKLDFAPLARFRVADKEFVIPSFGSYTFEYSPGEEVARVVVNINEQNIVLENSKELIVPIFDFKLGKPVQLSVNEIVSGDEQRGLFLRNGGSLNFEISSSIWNNWLEEKRFEFEIEKPTAIFVDTPSFSLDLIDFLVDSEEQKNCDVFQRGVVSKNIGNDGLFYETSNFGTYCESLKFIDIDTSYDFIVNIESNYEQGRQPRFLITSASDSFVYLQDLLKKPSSSYLFLAQPFENENYFINFELKSFGEEKSLASLNKAELIYFSLPIEVLSNVYLMTDGYQDFSGEILISNTQKIGTSFYSFDVEVVSDQGIVSLSQGYDQGWLAVSVDDGVKVFEHLRYKDWANAWLLGQGSYKVYVVYLPQVFVCFSFIILFISFIVLLPLKRNKKDLPDSPEEETAE